MSAQAVKMTVDWMFQQGQGDLLHSILILVSKYISAHLHFALSSSTRDTVTSTDKDTS